MRKAAPAVALVAVAAGVFAAAPAQASTTANTVTRTGTESTIVLNLTGFTPQAELAIEAAADYWANHLYSPVPIVMDLSWSALGASQGGQAGPAYYEHDTAGATPGFAYPKAIADALAGVDLTPGQNDVTGQFNSSANWSVDPTGAVSGKIDLQSVATHELGHGLGFVSDFRLGSGDGCTADGLACYGSPQGGNPPSYVYPYEFDRFVATAPPGGGHTLLSDPNNSAQLASDLQPTSGGLYWTGSAGIAGAGGNAVQMYAPSSWQQGSSGGAHLDESTYPAGNANALMTPQIGPGEEERAAGPIGLGIMQDIGWTVRTSNAPLASTKMLYSTDGGAHWTTDPTVTAGATILARIWYNNQDSKVTDSVSVATDLPAGFNLVPDSTKVCMSPLTSDPTAPNATDDFCAASQESAVWSGQHLSVSPTNGLAIDGVTAQPNDQTSGVFEPGYGFAEFQMIAPSPTSTTTYDQSENVSGAGVQAAGTVTVNVAAQPAPSPTTTPSPAATPSPAQSPAPAGTAPSAPPADVSSGSDASTTTATELPRVAG